MKITQENNQKNGTFTAYEDEQQAGLISYTWAGEGKFIIDHTEVNNAFRGKNVGQQLVLEAVAYARANHLKIMPLCPFAKSVFDKNQALGDVLF